MLTSQILSKALRDAALQEDDYELRNEAKDRLEEAIRKYSGIMSYSQDYIEIQCPSTDFTIGKPTVKKGKRCTYIESDMPSLEDYEHCGYIKDKDCIYRASDDTFYKISEVIGTEETTYLWQAFITSDYTVYFSVTPDIIVWDLDSILSIIANCGNVEIKPLTSYLRGSGDACVVGTGEGIVRIRLRDCFMNPNPATLQIVYTKLVVLNETSNITLTNEFLDLITTYTAYEVAKTAKAKEYLNAKLSDIETKVLTANESDNFLIIPDSYL